MLPIIYFGVYHLCYNLLLLMLVTLGPSAMFLDLNHLFFMSIFMFLILSMSCMHLLWSRTGDPKGDSLGHQRGWSIILGFHVSIEFIALFRCSLTGEP